uniref:hypothetical protein n=1 Tax=Alistipes sp. TaxID=1872444 RepID=UPI004056C9D5
MKCLKYMMRGLGAMLLSMALFTACSEDNTDSVVHAPAIDVTNKTLEPNATGVNGESGTVRAFIGTVVTAKGFNLDRVTRVEMGGMTAEIVEQTIAELKFKVPALELAQRDEAYYQDLYIYAGEELIFRYDYYVTVPVTDAIVMAYAPTEGTVGTTVKIEGRNLEQITEIRFGSVSLLSDQFTEVVAGSEQSSVSFTVPAGEYPAGESLQPIAALWGGSNEIDVTGENRFTLRTPKVEAMTQSEPNRIGDEITIYGEFLDLLGDYKWGDYAMIVLEGATAEAVTLKFPSSIEPTDPVLASADLTATWGEPQQRCLIAAAWQVDTTPQGPAKPLFESFTATDGGAENRLYLGKVVTVKGQNMASIEGFVVDGLEAELSGEPNDVEASFIVPDGVTFTEATDVKIEAIYGGGTVIDFFEAKVYPFYFFKGIRLGLGSSSKSTYTEYAAENAFFYPDLGRVVSTLEWKTTPLDPYAASGTNPAVKGGSVITAGTITSEDYYNVLPYIFFIANSSHKLSIAGCANSSSQIKNHCIYEEGSAVPLPSAYGTPLVMYRALGDDKKWAMAVKEDRLTSLVNYDGNTPGQGAPALGTEVKDGSTWMKGSVVAVGYFGFVEGEKPSKLEQLHKVGFMHITDLTCADLATGLANEDRAGYVEFDLYWSKAIR